MADLGPGSMHDTIYNTLTNLIYALRETHPRNRDRVLALIEERWNNPHHCQRCRQAMLAFVTIISTEHDHYQKNSLLLEAQRIDGPPLIEGEN